MGVAVATVKKFSEDQSANLAAMIAFWAFFSVFPLLLVLVTILGYVLPESTRTSVLSNVAAYFPLLDTSTVHGLTGSWWPVLGVYIMKSLAEVLDRSVRNITPALVQ